MGKHKHKKKKSKKRRRSSSSSSETSSTKHRKHQVQDVALKETFPVTIGPQLPVVAPITGPNDNEYGPSLPPELAVVDVQAESADDDEGAVIGPVLIGPDVEILDPVQKKLTTKS